MADEIINNIILYILISYVFSLLIGFRIVRDDYKNINLLSSVRCSLLESKVIDKDKCTLLRLDAPVNTTTNVYNQKWQHDCTKGYGLVGVYSDTHFVNVSLGKCCKITGKHIMLYSRAMLS